jgi:uncharacterized protein (DUF488 family)
MNLFTIGFTKTTAEAFFSKLRKSGATRLIDVRLNNVSQLAGFAKRNDLEYFLREICEMQYLHLPDLAPTQDMLDRYRKGGGDWQSYESEFLDLMQRRRIEQTLSPDLLSEGCLLCSEDKPHHCHRRLVAEYLNEHWGNVEILHLV